MNESLSPHSFIHDSSLLSRLSSAVCCAKAMAPKREGSRIDLSKYQSKDDFRTGAMIMSLVKAMQPMQAENLSSSEEEEDDVHREGKAEYKEWAAYYKRWKDAGCPDGGIPGDPAPKSKFPWDKVKPGASRPGQEASSSSSAHESQPQNPVADQKSLSPSELPDMQVCTKKNDPSRMVSFDLQKTEQTRA